MPEDTSDNRRVFGWLAYGLPYVPTPGMPSRALICAVLSVSAVNLGRMAGSNNKAYQITYPNAGLDPMGNSRAILRTAARANGWRVSIDSDPESSADLPAAGRARQENRGVVGGPGNVRMAALYDGGFISRYDDHSTKAQRVLSVLSGRTDDFPPHRPNDLAVGYNLTASHLLPTVPMVEMRWYARPEGDRQQLRVAPRLASWNKADDRGSGSAAGVSRRHRGAACRLAGRRPVGAPT